MAALTSPSGNSPWIELLRRRGLWRQGAPRPRGRAAARVEERVLAEPNGAALTEVASGRLRCYFHHSPDEVGRNVGAGVGGARESQD